MSVIATGWIFLAFIAVAVIGGGFIVGLCIPTPQSVKTAITEARSARALDFEIIIE